VTQIENWKFTTVKNCSQIGIIYGHMKHDSNRKPGIYRNLNMPVEGVF